MKTTVQIRKVFNATDSKVKAIVSITLDDLFVIHGVKVIETERGRFLAMPNENRPDAQGENMRRNIFHPITSDARRQLEKAVFEAYEGYLVKGKSAPEISK
ncbi:MAG: SpoVG family protein [Ethanoligenens sp.]